MSDSYDLPDEFGWKFGAFRVEGPAEPGRAWVRFIAEKTAGVREVDMLVDVPWKQGQEQADIEATALHFIAMQLHELAERADARGRGKSLLGDSSL